MFPYVDNDVHLWYSLSSFFLILRKTLLSLKLLHENSFTKTTFA